MTKILSIDASAEACSVALLNGNETTQRYEIAPRQHAKLLLPMVDELLTASHLNLNQLDAIACNVGPGAFTGIRIAVSVAQGLAYGANLPTISLSSLANLAAYGYAKTVTDKAVINDWLCAIDARMDEIYFASYQIKEGIPVLQNEEIVIAPHLIDFENLKQTVNFQKVGLIGSAWPEYSNILYGEHLSEKLLIPGCYPNAVHALKQAQLMFNNQQILSPEKLQPTYLRNNVAKKKLVNN